MGRYFFIPFFVMQLFGCHLVQGVTNEDVFSNPIVLEHGHAIRSISFSPNGRTIASGGYDNNIKLWDVTTGQLKATLTGHTDWIKTLQFSSDGRTLAAIDDDNMLKLWDVSTGNEKQTLAVQVKYWQKFAIFSPDSRLLAFPGDSKTIVLWDIENNKILHELVVAEDYKQAEFTPDNALMVTINRDTIQLWDTKSGRQITSKSFKQIKDIVVHDKDGILILTGDGLSFWNIQTDRLTELMTDDYQTVTYKAKKIFLSDKDGKIHYFDINGKKISQSFASIHTSEIMNLIYSPEKELLFSASQNELKIWDISKSPELIVTLETSSEIDKADFISSKLVAYGGQKLYLWSTEKTHLQELKQAELQALPDRIQQAEEDIAELSEKTIHQIIEADEIFKEIIHRLGEIDSDELEIWFKKLYAYEEKGDLTGIDQFEQQFMFLLEKLSPEVVTEINKFRLLEYLHGRTQIVPNILKFKSNKLQSINDLAALRIKVQKSQPSGRVPMLHQFYTMMKENNNLDMHFIQDAKRISILAHSYRLRTERHLLEMGKRFGIMEEAYERSRRAIVLNSLGLSKASPCASKQRQVNIPLSNAITPLPRNGLFTRRNNQFGTKINVGIKELIEQGVMIEQRNIRFDDFVFFNTSGIPRPQDNHALAISHGQAIIPFNQKPRDKSTHYLEIALKAATSAPLSHPRATVPAVNYVFVVDTSGSMSGDKISTVKASIRELFEQLQDEDVIGVVAFDDQAKTIFKALPKKKIDPLEFGAAINNLQAAGSTDINLGLSYGIHEIKRYGDDPQRLNQIFVFSDGQPTSGETDWMKIRANLAGKTRDNINLSAFAYGTDADRLELDKLAGLTGGKSIFVIEATDVINNLQEELMRRDNIAAMNIQMKIRINPAATIWHFYGHDYITDPVQRKAVIRELEKTKHKAKEEFGIDAPKDIVTEKDGIRIFVPDLAIGETYWVALELELPEGFDKKPVGQATVQYLDTFVRKNEKHTFDLTPKGQIEPAMVVQHALGLHTSEEIFYALDDLYVGDLDTAEKRIEAHITLLESYKTYLQPTSRSASPNCYLKQTVLANMKDDIITLGKFLSLAQNLGKPYGISDTSGTRAYMVHSLDQFGQVRGGYQRVHFQK